MTDLLTSGLLTDDERLADLTSEQLRQLIGLVDYDAADDPFPVTGWDSVVLVVCNAVQTARHYQSAYGMTLVAYSGPETGHRHRQGFVLTSGSCRFVILGGVDPDSEFHDHHRRHGDGVLDISLEVPDVDRCVTHARRVLTRDQLLDQAVVDKVLELVEQQIAPFSDLRGSEWYKRRMARVFVKKAIERLNGGAA